MKNRIQKIIYILCALIVFSFHSSIHATPLSMSYKVTDLGGSYRYNFTLTLDNHDSSWVAGNEWDWIVFGDNDSSDSYTGFDTDGGGLIQADWTTSSFSAPIGAILTSSGGHNGPTLAIHTTVTLPGWNPTAIGESLTWSGTSGILIPAGELYWSSLITGGGASAVNYELATPVPEPSTALLLVVGLLSLMLSYKKTTCNRLAS